jgi:hypothetical protein
MHESMILSGKREISPAATSIDYQHRKPPPVPPWLWTLGSRSMPVDIPRTLVTLVQKRSFRHRAARSWSSVVVL